MPSSLLGRLSSAPANTVGSTFLLHAPFSGSFASGKEYYVEIGEGGGVGHRFEIIEATSTAGVLVLDTASTLNTTTTIPHLNGERITVRQHWTVDEIFDKGLFHGTNTPGTADQIKIWDRAANAYVTYWLYLTGNKWVKVGDATLTDVGTRVVPPSEGWFVSPKVAMNGSLPSYGLVRDQSFRQALPTGLTLASLGFPQQMSFTSNYCLQADGFTAATSPTTSDRVQFWTGDTTPSSQSWQTYWYYSGSPVRWVRQGDATLTNQNTSLLFNRQRANFYNMKAAVSNRLVSCPWQP